jgi:hypothetical protein
MIWARTWRILELLGLAEKFIKVTDIPPSPDVGAYLYDFCGRSAWNFILC